MSGATTQSNIERERTAIVTGIRGIHQMKEVMAAGRQQKAWTWLALLGIMLVPSTILAWSLPPVSGGMALLVTVVSFIIMICTVAVVDRGLGTRRLIGLKETYGLQDTDEYAAQLANAYVATCNVPAALQGKVWQNVDLLTYQLVYDGVTYTLSFDETVCEVPMFSVPKGVLPEDQRRQRELDVLFLHLSQRKAELYGITYEPQLPLDARADATTPTA